MIVVRRMVSRPARDDRGQRRYASHSVATRSVRDVEHGGDSADNRQDPGRRHLAECISRAPVLGHGGDHQQHQADRGGRAEDGQRETDEHPAAPANSSTPIRR